jgi:signal transduction histidine kinase
VEGGVTARENDPVVLLSNLPVTTRQRRLVLALGVILLAAFGIVAPFAHLPLGRFDSFIPSLGATIFVNDLITSVLLFAQYSIVPSRAILVLASGYFFTALIVIPHALTFPGAFAPTGLLGAGLQTTAWLYFLWHIGSPIAVLTYAYLKDAKPTNVKRRAAVFSIGWSVAIVTALVCGLAWSTTAGERFLPALFSDSTRHIQTPLYTSIPLILLISVFALALLWVRRRSVLDYWLMLVLWALILEVILISLLSGARFSLGFYAGRGFSLVTSIIVLVLLLAETTKLYLRLAHSYQLLEQERDDKLMNVEAITASIAHEVRQPLTAISTNSSAALRFLGKAPPDLHEVAAALKSVNMQSVRVSEVFDSIHALFRKTDREQQLIDLNEIILEVLNSLRDELERHHVTTHTELTTEVPPISGHEGQLRQVILNLVRNAREAMDNTKDRGRMLQVRTELHGSDAIVVTIEDSGPGIDPKQLNGIFDAFVTTKSHGIGLGLAICRTIIERHGGQISALSDGKNGTLFRFFLPIKSTDTAIVRMKCDI